MEESLYTLIPLARFGTNVNSKLQLHEKPRNKYNDSDSLRKLGYLAYSPKFPHYPYQLPSAEKNTNRKQEDCIPTFLHSLIIQ